MKPTRLHSLAVVAVLLGAGIGCAPAYVQADVAPPDIESYPVAYYDGQPAYLVGDRWYFRNSNGWAYYRHEPDVLVQRRAYYRSRTTQTYSAPRTITPRREVPRDDRREEKERR